ncbi:MAG: BamA/TamA family outer membrane protein, partial [Ignavibacteria bacterium]|nr:BamA/TamA family outer membrane protein [Ignavibacteria bacterium]
MKIKHYFFVLFFLILGSNVNAQEEPKMFDSFRDSLDNAFDVSDFLLNKRGFLLVPMVITEPAVGFGAVATAVYFHSAYSEKKGPPSMSGALGGGTVNGTWLAGAFHIGYWKHDRIRYMGALARTYANIEFYGSGKLGILDDISVNLNLDAWLFVQQIKFRLAETNFFLGGRYILFNTDNTFEIPVNSPDFQGIEFSSQLSEIKMLVNYDSRNNIFTPRKGLFIELSGSYSDDWMGGDGLYGRINNSLLAYVPINEKFVLGIRHESAFSLGDVPFYARPYIVLRGAPAMKYQNKNTMVMEAELNWNLVNRWYMTGFTGMGNAFADFESLSEGKSVSTFGAGFRYLLARKFGAQMGMDF